MPAEPQGHPPDVDASPDEPSSPSDTATLSSRPIRSFIIRNGRLTDAQAAAVETLMPRFGIAFEHRTLDLAACFGRDAPRWLEIGFGNGDALLDMASRHPHVDFIGIEVHAPGVGRLLRALERRGLSNVRVIRHDAVEVLDAMIPPATLERVLLLFPDPWRKKRHHKRRIVQRDFVRAVARVLTAGGIFHAATDWENYAEHMLEVLDADPDLESLAGRGRFSPRPESRPLTRFESRGLGLGHAVHDLLYRRC